MNKLNFGCGSIIASGWHNVDKEDFGQQYVGSTELFEDNYFEIIVAHASLQMVGWHDIPATLLELHRILKPGGVFRISLPDAVGGFEAYFSGNMGWFPNDATDIEEAFCGWINWFSTTKTLFTPELIIRRLESAKFREIHTTDFMETLYGGKESVELDSRKGEFYFIECRK